MIRKSLFILSILFTAACGTTYRHEIDKAETLMTEHPDSSLNILEKIRIEHIRGHKNKAKYALLYSQALDKNYIDVEDDSIIRIARDYYARRGSNTDRAKAFYYYGTVANNAGDTNEAMKAFIPARIYAEKTDDEYIKGLIYSAIGALYYSQNSIEESINNFTASAKSFESIHHYNQMLSLKSIGELYRISNNLDSALLYLHRAKSKAEDYNDTLQLINIELKIQSINIKINDNQEIIEESKTKLLNTYKRLGYKNIPQLHYPIFGQIYLKQSKIDSAKHYFLSSLKHMSTITDDNIGIYIALSECEKEIENYKEALRYREIYNHLFDSIKYIQQINLIEKLEHKYKAQYLERSYAILESKHKLQKLSNTLILILIIIIGGILVFLYRYIAIRKNQKIEEYRLYIEDVDSNYENLVLKYKNLKEQAASKGDTANKLLELLGRRIDSMKTLCNISIKSVFPHKFKEKFTEYINLENKDNKAIAEDMITLANIMYNDIVTRMGDKFGLTDHEKTFCACVILDFTKEEIRVLFNHTNVSSICNTRCKMRDKFGLKGSSLDLLKYIKALRDNPDATDDNSLIINSLQTKK